ncbi:MAG: tetratricopeptide repeat protein [Pedobacter sp.]|nr:tetratricopeptide repeat protein [Pedobacter sp.]
MSQHDEEQVENLKRFFKDYGTPILTGVVLALAVFAGWKYWNGQKIESSTKAANVFQDMLGAVQRSHMNPADKVASTDVQRYAKTLREDYAKTPFAASAGLLLARQAVDRNDFKEAEKQLRWVLEQKPEESVRILASTRLARVLTADKKYDEALALLSKESDAGFKPTVEELKGDIYQAQGKIPEAQKAYLAAVAALQDRDDERRPLLEMKMADVGVAPPEKKAAGKDDKAATESKSS